MITKPLIGLAALSTVLMTALCLEYINHCYIKVIDLPPLHEPTTLSMHVLLPPQDVPVFVETILGRPLFRVGRRPPSPDGVPTELLPRLSAILVSPNSKRLIFSSAAGGKPIVVAEGDHIGLYVVGSIVAGQAVIWGPEGSRIIWPSFKRQEVAITPLQMATQTLERQPISIFPPGTLGPIQSPINR